MIEPFTAPGTPLPSALAEAGRLTDLALDKLVKVPAGPEARVWEAMRYAVLAPGKRLRPFFVLASAALFAVSTRSALQVAAAVEMVHAYSLVHDDLPAMDDSDLRRGRPTVHKRFDEATAILAGDGLLTLAFATLADPDTHGDAAVRCELVAGLAAAAGSSGMVGGQMLDLLAQNNSLDIPAITRMQRMKTGEIIGFACEAGAILAKTAAEPRQALRGFAHDLGLAFQIVDDLLDAESTAEEVGKPVGRDAGAGKATFVAILGAERARAQAKLLVDQASAHLDMFEDRANLLQQAARYVLDRRA